MIMFVKHLHSSGQVNLLSTNISNIEKTFERNLLTIKIGIYISVIEKLSYNSCPRPQIRGKFILIWPYLIFTVTASEF